MNDNLRRALEALETGAREVRALSTRSAAEARSRLRQTLHEADAHLGDEDDDGASSQEDIFAQLDRQSKNIADDLRRAQELMRKRTGQQ